MEELEQYAELNFIPIMQKEGMEFLKDFIIKKDIKNILELGTAIGYSAINMALINKDIKVTTIERDKVRYDEAVKNINKFHLNDQIKLINSDIFDVDLSDKYDLIFIDAAKSQNTKFFIKFENNLSGKGFIITDNINFHGLTNNDSIKSRNLRQMVRKIREYKDYLTSNQKFETIFTDVGDGLSISWRK